MIESPFGVERVINLRAAIAGLAERFHELPQFFGGFSEQIHGGLSILRRHLVSMIARGRERPGLGVFAEMTCFRGPRTSVD